jgi:hypothetical protein
VLHVAVDQRDGRPVRAVGAPPTGRWRTERSGGAGPDLILHLTPAATAAAAAAPDAEEAA